MKIVIAILMLSVIAKADSVTYTRVGNFTYGSDGSSYAHAGNYTYGSDGSTRVQVGNSNYNVTPQPVLTPSVVNAVIDILDED